MNPVNKIKFVKKNILEKAIISSSNVFDINIMDYVDAVNGVPDDALVLCSSEDQINILEKLDKEGFFLFLLFTEDFKRARVVLKEEIYNRAEVEYNLIKLEEDETIISKWVDRDNDGNYSFNGNQIHIKNKKSTYFVIFDVIYSIIPNGGIIKYKDIIEGCKKRKIKVTIKTILSSLSGKDARLFKYIKGIDIILNFNKPLFNPIGNGKEIEFNNKK